jgi:hypothetical protein
MFMPMFQGEELAAASSSIDSTLPPVYQHLAPAVHNLEQYLWLCSFEQHTVDDLPTAMGHSHSLTCHVLRGSMYIQSQCCC